MEKTKTLMGAMQKCGADKDVQAALSRMGKPKSPPPAK